MLKEYQALLEEIFELLNGVYFSEELEMPVITIMTSKRSYGHFTCAKVWREETEHKHEINISADYLDRPIENITATLLHEMVHYYCLNNNISDTSQNGRYHNKRFKEEAEKRGLIISYDRRIGWSLTEPSPELIELLKHQGISKHKELNRDGGFYFNRGTGGQGDDNNGVSTGAGDGDTGKKKTSTRKYVCPKCGNSFRATKDINVMCMDCMEVFVKIEK